MRKAVKTSTQTLPKKKIITTTEETYISVRDLLGYARSGLSIAEGLVAVFSDMSIGMVKQFLGTAVMSMVGPLLSLFMALEAVKKVSAVVAMVTPIAQIAARASGMWAAPGNAGDIAKIAMSMAQKALIAVAMTAYSSLINLVLNYEIKIYSTSRSREIAIAIEQAGREILDTIIDGIKNVTSTSDTANDSTSNSKGIDDMLSSGSSADGGTRDDGSNGGNYADISIGNVTDDLNDTITENINEAIDNGVEGKESNTGTVDINPNDPLYVSDNGLPVNVRGNELAYNERIFVMSMFNKGLWYSINGIDWLQAEEPNQVRTGTFGAPFYFEPNHTWYVGSDEKTKTITRTPFNINLGTMLRKKQIKMPENKKYNELSFTGKTGFSTITYTYNTDGSIKTATGNMGDFDLYYENGNLFKQALARNYYEHEAVQQEKFYLNELQNFDKISKIYFSDILYGGNDEEGGTKLGVINNQARTTVILRDAGKNDHGLEFLPEGIFYDGEKLVDCDYPYNNENVADDAMIEFDYRAKIYNGITEFDFGEEMEVMEVRSNKVIDLTGITNYINTNLQTLDGIWVLEEYDTTDKYYAKGQPIIYNGKIYIYQVELPDTYQPNPDIEVPFVAGPTVWDELDGYDATNLPPVVADRNTYYDYAIYDVKEVLDNIEYNTTTLWGNDLYFWGSTLEIDNENDYIVKEIYNAPQLSLLLNGMYLENIDYDGIGIWYSDDDSSIDGLGGKVWQQVMDTTLECWPIIKSIDTGNTTPYLIAFSSSDAGIRRLVNESIHMFGQTNIVNGSFYNYSEDSTTVCGTTLYRTYDNGVYWNSVNIPGFATIIKTNALTSNGKAIFIAGSAEGLGLWYCEDIDLNEWHQSDKTGGDWYSLALVGNNVVAGSYDGNGLWYTKDNGLTWKESNIERGVYTNLVSNYDYSKVYAGNSECARVTTNGIKWDTYSVFPTRFFTCNGNVIINQAEVLSFDLSSKLLTYKEIDDVVIKILNRVSLPFLCDYFFGTFKVPDGLVGDIATLKDKNKRTPVAIGNNATYDLSTYSSIINWQDDCGMYPLSSMTMNEALQLDVIPDILLYDFNVIKNTKSLTNILKVFRAYYERRKKAFVGNLNTQIDNILISNDGITDGLTPEETNAAIYMKQLYAGALVAGNKSYVEKIAEVLFMLDEPLAKKILISFVDEIIRASMGLIKSGIIEMNKKFVNDPTAVNIDVNSFGIKIDNKVCLDRAIDKWLMTIADNIKILDGNDDRDLILIACSAFKNSGRTEMAEKTIDMLNTASKIITKPNGMERRLEHFKEGLINKLSEIFSAYPNINDVNREVELRNFIESNPIITNKEFFLKEAFDAIEKLYLDLMKSFNDSLNYLTFTPPADWSEYEALEENDKRKVNNYIYQIIKQYRSRAKDLLKIIYSRVKPDMKEQVANNIYTQTINSIKKELVSFTDGLVTTVLKEVDFSTTEAFLSNSSVGYVRGSSLDIINYTYTNSFDIWLTDLITIFNRDRGVV